MEINKRIIDSQLVPIYRWL